MNMTFNGRTRKCWQMTFVQKNIFVSNESHPRIIHIQPTWNLAIGDDVNVSDPGCVHF